MEYEKLNKLLWEIAAVIVSVQKTSYQCDPKDFDKLDWGELEVDWFDYLEEKLNTIE